MAEKRIFVGREDELKQFVKVLERARGETVLVVGHRGMGKTWLINKMAEIAQKHPKLKCGCVRYEVTPTDSVDSTMALMMDNAFEAAQVEEGSFDGTPRRLQQWKALLNIIKIGDLVMSLRRDPAKNTREQFLERLRLISKRMPENGRAVFIIDPEKYMQEKSDQSWAIVVKNLPENIKFVFAQRTEDALIDSETIDALGNVVRIPEKRLGVLEKNAIDELLKSRAKKVGYTVKQLEKALSQYKGHPYAIGATLDLIEAGTKLEELPKKPETTKFAEVQWKKVCSSGEGAIDLFEAYAILEVGVPDDVVEAVSGLKSSRRRKLLVDKYIGGLLREEGEGRRIYHAILADYIVGQIGEGEKKTYHSRAVEVYRGKLAAVEEAQTKPDALAAMRLSEHVLAAEGEKAFVYVFVNECFGALDNLGLLDAAISLSKRALAMVDKGSRKEGMVRGNLGMVYRIRGDLGRAEEMHRRALIIAESLGDAVGMATQYNNLGVLYRTRGELEKAEEMHTKALEIDERIGRLKGMANDYGGLGIVYSVRRDLDRAEEMHRKALEIEKRLGRLEGMASNYGNLGVVYKQRGELGKAEEMYQMALEIKEKLGHVKGMGVNYGNLGVIYCERGDLEKAEEMFRKALEIDEEVGQLGGIADRYAGLGIVYGERRDFDKSREMHLESLKIEGKIGRPVGMARQYANLGEVYKRKGDVRKAKEYWEKALELYKKIGIPHMVEKVQGWIDGLREK